MSAYEYVLNNKGITMIKFTRNDLRNKECTHNEYFAQFVTASSLAYVKKAVGLAKLQASKCPHLNDIVSKRGLHSGGGWLWDCTPVNHDLLREAGERSCASTSTCIGKAAARQLLAEANA